MTKAAQEIVEASTPRDGLLGTERPPIPGKKAQPEPRIPVGHQGVDQGPACEGAEDSALCFLEPAQRDRMIHELGLRLVRVEGAYLRALDALKLETLLKKEEDIHWITSVALDLIIAVTSSSLTNGLSQLGTVGHVFRGKKVPGGGAGPTEATMIQKALAQATPNRVETVIKQGVDLSKKQLAAHLKNFKNADFQSINVSALGFIAQLKNEATNSFTNLNKEVSGHCSDAELVFLFGRFENDDTFQDATYEKAIREKIARFHKSGVASIGRVADRNNETSPIKLATDTRVVQVFYVSGHPSEWRYQKSVATSMGKDLPNESTLGFGEARGRTAPPSWLGDVVPKEFVELARAQHEHIWGSKKGDDYLQIDEHDYAPHVYGTERWLKARMHHAKPGRPLTPQIQPQPHSPAPTTPKPAASGVPTQPTSFGAAREPIIPLSGPILDGVGDS